MTLQTVREVREYVDQFEVKQAAFQTVAGSIILVVIDRDGDIGVVDPGGNISFRFLWRCANMMPLTPMIPERPDAAPTIEP